MLQKAWEHEQWLRHVPALAAALQIPEGRLTGRNVDALWHLCQQEAGLWGITNQACSLFSPQVNVISAGANAGCQDLFCVRQNLNASFQGTCYSQCRTTLQQGRYMS